MAHRTVEDRLCAGINWQGPVMPGMDTCCWVWTKHIDDNGYGAMGVAGRKRRVHVVAFELEHGPVPEGMYVLHHCDNRPCIRHTYLGTKKNNAQDREVRGRSNHASGKRHGCATHPGLHYGEANGRAKITEVDAWSIRDVFSCGKVTVEELAASFDLTETTVWNILHGKLWAKAGGPVVPAAGRARGTRHWHASFTEEQVASIRAEFTGRYGEQKRLAEKYGVDVQTIKRVVRGRTYATAEVCYRCFH